VHDGAAIWESAAITIYHGELFGVKTKVYPKLGPKRREAMQWIVWTNTTFTEAAYCLAHSLAHGREGGVESTPLSEPPVEDRGQNLTDKAKNDISGHLGVLQRGLVQKNLS
jgi:glutathione S-transferase